MQEELQAKAQSLGIVLTKHQLKQFELYVSTLLSWNSKINLTAITNPSDIITKHFIDSLSVLQAIPITSKKLIDIGSGAGFPGIPLKIVRPELEVTLLESVGKKTLFLEQCIAELKLKNIFAITGRAEDAGHDKGYRQTYDVVTARAVAQLSTLAEYALPFLKVGGIFIAQKSAGTEEIKNSEQALKILGGSIQKVLPLAFPGLENRQLIVIEKIAKTPIDYPRRAGIPQKNPLS